ncbi:MAG: single-stranded-DNA-specific exonuclease RecJ, partial [Fusobacteriaceae bacterium]
MEWEYCQKQNQAEDLAKKLDISNFLATLLLNRGFIDEDEIKKFISPQLSDFRDPFDFENMEAVIEKILEIKRKKSKIFIYGDYDVDGITSAVFLTKAFKELDIDVEYYIPNRMEEDYGLDKHNLKYMKSRGAELVITVDTSISSIEDIRYGRSIGIDVIITDHHKSAKEKEDDEVLYVNPKLSEKYSFKYLAGAGVALKVAQALYIKLGISMERLYKYLDIVMIGTVADVVPIVDENRIIVKEGLKRLKDTEVKGLVYMMKYLKFQHKTITTTDISYFIAPLINSLGRIGTSRIGAKFFMEENEVAIYDIIEEMKRSNKRRRELEKEIYDEAVSLVEKKLTAPYKGIFLVSKKWHPGVIGIVSSRLSIKYRVPVVLISLRNGVGKASSRSVSGINIFNIFKDMSHLLTRFGGHDLAAGFIAEEYNLNKIRQFFMNAVENLNESNERKSLSIDMEFPVEKISEETIQDIEILSPYGIENGVPLLVD